VTQVTAGCDEAHIFCRSGRGNIAFVGNMTRRHRRLRIALQKQPVVWLFLLLAIVVEPLNLRAACTPCTTPCDNCCRQLRSCSATMCSLSLECCSVFGSRNQGLVAVSKSREISGRSELQDSQVRAVVPALRVRLSQSNAYFPSPPVLPPLTPLSQSCLLLI
jgi:hypothetical protein